MKIIQDKAVELITKRHSQITALIPKSKVLEVRGEYAKVLVYLGQEEWLVLRNLGYDVPHPLGLRYKFPGAYKPKPHQVDTAIFAASNPRSYIFNDMGTGKTMAAAWAADWLLSEKAIRRVLVVCPLSIMESAWVNDLFASVMHRSVAIARHSDPDKRREIIHGKYEFVIINHDGIKAPYTKDLIKAGFDLVIIDELDAFKTHDSDRSKALRKVCADAKYVWGMTGTPAAQSPTEAYGLAKVVRPDTVPYSFNEFKTKVEYKISQFKWVKRPEANQIVHELLQPAIRYSKDECLTLPEKTIHSIYVPMTSQQNKYYQQMKEHLLLTLSSTEVVAPNAAVLCGKLLQIASGSVYTEDRQVIDFDISTRYEALKREVMDAVGKTIVFVTYSHALGRLKEQLEQDGITVGVIDGSVPLNARTSVIKAFQQEANPQVLLLKPRSAAHGITLTKASTVVWWGPFPSIGTYQQANDRAHRNGQVNPVRVVQLHSAPIETKFFKELSKGVGDHMDLLSLYKEEIGL